MPGVIKDYWERALKLPLEEFVSFHPEPVLVQRGDESGQDPRSEYRSTLRMEIDQASGEMRPSLPPPTPMSRVFALQKSSRDSSPDKILVGRTETNDIVVPHLTVSKHHAYFKPAGESGAWVLVDMESTNGTALNSQPVKEKESRPLRDGDGIDFGEMRFTFYSASAFFDLLRSLSVLT